MSFNAAIITTKNGTGDFLSPFERDATLYRCPLFSQIFYSMALITGSTLTHSQQFIIHHDLAISLKISPTLDGANCLMVILLKSGQTCKIIIFQAAVLKVTNAQVNYGWSTSPHSYAQMETLMDIPKPFDQWP